METRDLELLHISLHCTKYIKAREKGVDMTQEWSFCGIRKEDGSSFDTFPEVFKEVCRIGDEIRDTVFKSRDLVYAVVASKVDESGSVISRQVDILTNFAETCLLMNRYEYIDNLSVNVFYVEKDGYIHMYFKVYDGCCYSRLAQVKKDQYEEKAVLKKLYHTGTTVKFSN